VVAAGARFHGRSIPCLAEFSPADGATAATLTGLVFVAASLGANLMGSAEVTGGIGTFVTPSVIHFTTVLLVAMLCTILARTCTSLGLPLASGCRMSALTDAE
jgi:hypothetical protein